VLWQSLFAILVFLYFDLLMATTNRLLVVLSFRLHVPLPLWHHLAADLPAASGLVLFLVATLVLGLRARTENWGYYKVLGIESVLLVLLALGAYHFTIGQYFSFAPHTK
jgi:intracellular septation protein A